MQSQPSRPSWAIGFGLEADKFSGALNRRQYVYLPIVVQRNAADRVAIARQAICARYSVVHRRARDYTFSRQGLKVLIIPMPRLNVFECVRDAIDHCEVGVLPKFLSKPAETRIVDSVEDSDGGQKRMPNRRRVRFKVLDRWIDDLFEITVDIHLRQPGTLHTENG